MNSRPSGERGRTLSRRTSELMASTVRWQMVPFSDLGNLGREKDMGKCGVSLNMLNLRTYGTSEWIF